MEIETVGSANISIPLKNVGVIRDIKIHIIVQSSVPSLLSNQKIIVNGLDMSIQEPCLIFEGKKEALELKDFLLIYNWSLEDLKFSLYAKTGLRKQQRSFRIPSMNAMLKELK